MGTETQFVLEDTSLQGVTRLYIAKDGVTRGGNINWWIYKSMPEIRGHSWQTNCTHIGFIRDIVKFTGVEELAYIYWRDSLFVVKLD